MEAVILGVVYSISLFVVVGAIGLVYLAVVYLIGCIIRRGTEE